MSSWLTIVRRFVHRSQKRVFAGVIILMFAATFIAKYYFKRPDVVSSTIEIERFTRNDNGYAVPSDYVGYRKHFMDMWNTTDIMADLSLPKKTDKLIIYRCGKGMDACGGWGARVKGIIIGYLMAYLTKRDFKVELLSPDCDITEALVPNRLDWRLPKLLHGTVDPHKPPPKGTQVLALENKAHTFFDNIDFSRIVNSSVPIVYMKANYDYMALFKANKVYEKELAWMRDMRKDKIFSELYRLLLRPSPQLLTHLQQFWYKHVPTRNHKLICAHIRMGQDSSLGVAKEGVRTASSSLPNAWNFFSKHSSSDLHKVFIMSDSDDVIRQASQQTGFGSRVLTTPGIIKHIEKSSHDEGVCEAQEKVIFDQAILMSCDVLMITPSSIGRMAAFLRGTDEGLFCMFKNGKIIKCRADEFTELYNLKG